MAEILLGSGPDGSEHLAGYLALAPDLFSDGGLLRCVVATMRSMFTGTGKPFADIRARSR